MAISKVNEGTEKNLLQCHFSLQTRGWTWGYEMRRQRLNYTAKCWLASASVLPSAVHIALPTTLAMKVSRLSLTDTRPEYFLPPSAQPPTATSVFSWGSLFFSAVKLAKPVIVKSIYKITLRHRNSWRKEFLVQGIKTQVMTSKCSWYYVSLETSSDVVYPELPPGSRIKYLRFAEVSGMEWVG